MPHLFEQFVFRNHSFSVPEEIKDELENAWLGLNREAIYANFKTVGIEIHIVK